MHSAQTIGCINLPIELAMVLNQAAKSESGLGS